MPKHVALRPATRSVLGLLVELGDVAVDVLMSDLVTELSLSARAVRRAIRELEDAGHVVCERDLQRHKTVTLRTDTERIGRDTGPSPAHTGPIPAQYRPKPAQRDTRVSSLINQTTDVVAVAETPAREAQRQPQQQRLALLGNVIDADRRAAAKALRKLNKELQTVWKRRGRRYGFLSAEDACAEGLATALDNYPWDEIQRCVLWSAERLADGLLSGGYFATTFKGNAFPDRHRKWLDHVERTERNKRRAELDPTPDVEGPQVAHERIGELASQWLQERR